jgi:hypothetical protein
MRTLVLVLGILLAFPVLAKDKTPPAQGKSPDRMRDANRAASLLVRERMKRDRPNDYRRFCRIRRADVLVVTGSYDHVETVLRDLVVPYRTVRPERVATQSFAGIRIVFVNCPGNVGKAGVAALKRFTREGRTLVTTDWALLNVIEPAFPRTVRYSRRPTRDDVVDVDPLIRRHPIVSHVFTGSDPHVWWLENHSYPIEVLDRRRVEVLITSAEMKRKYGEPAIAVTFAAGKGRVYHMVSHAYLQRSERRSKKDRLPTASFAGAIGFAEDSEVMKRVRKAKLDKVETGQLRSAYSSQQMLANILVEAAPKETPPVVEPTPEPPPPPPVTGKSATAARSTKLRDGPAGKPFKAIPKGLRLSVIARRDGWVQVRTPAGEVGWVTAGEVGEVRRER